MRPAAGRTPEALNVTGSPATCGTGDTTKSPVGAAEALTTTLCVVEAERPRSLVTVSVTTKVPIVVNACVTVLPDAVAPSPKVQP